MKTLILLISLFSLHSSIILSRDIHGVNWADVRDNYADDELVLSGLTSSETYETAYEKSDIVLSTFINDLGANTVRIPVNPPTVLGDYFEIYKASIDKALSKNMKVILGYWEGPNGKDGQVDDLTSFWSMWKTLTTTYKNDEVYFEIMNEPFGYSKDNWAKLCEKWLNKYSEIPHNRVLIGGTGYDDSVIEMGNDSRFTDCLLSQHLYPFWNTAYTTETEWLNELKKRIGNHAYRTVITEFGTEMDTTHGIFDYSIENSGDGRIAFMRAIVTYIYDNDMGCTVWPGLRTKDTYSIYALDDSGEKIKLIKNNESVIPLLRYAFNVESSFVPTKGSSSDNAKIKEGVYVIKNVNSELVLSISSKDAAAKIVQNAYLDISEQRWKIESLGGGYYGIINVDTGFYLDVNQSSKKGGANIIQWYGNEAANQKWKFVKCGEFYYIVNQNSEMYLDVNKSSTEANAEIIQWYGNEGNNQKWILESV